MRVRAVDHHIVCRTVLEANRRIGVVFFEFIMNRADKSSGLLRHRQGPLQQFEITDLLFFRIAQAADHIELIGDGECRLAIPRVNRALLIKRAETRCCRTEYNTGSASFMQLAVMPIRTQHVIEVTVGW